MSQRCQKQTSQLGLLFHKETHDGKDVTHLLRFGAINRTAMPYCHARATCRPRSTRRLAALPPTTSTWLS